MIVATSGSPFSEHTRPPVPAGWAGALVFAYGTDAVTRCQCRVAGSGVMDRERFWQVVEVARAQAPGPDDAEGVAGLVSAGLAARPAGEIVAAEQTLWDLMADSYTTPLWAAAYLINGGCSDDGFDYFRGWLIAQGREVFERAVADPDALADLPVVRACAADGGFLEGEEILGVAWNAHLAATGERIPQGACTIRYPAPAPAWDFDDAGEMGRRLPRLAGLFLE